MLQHWSITLLAGDEGDELKDALTIESAFFVI